VINTLPSSVCITFIIVGYAITAANAIHICVTVLGLRLANTFLPATLTKLDVAVLPSFAVLVIETIFACVDFTVVVAVVVTLTIGFDALSSIVSLAFIIVGLAVTGTDRIQVPAATFVRKLLAHTIHPVTLAKLDAAIVTTIAIQIIAIHVKLAPVDFTIIVLIGVTVTITFTSWLVVGRTATLGFGATLGVSILVAEPVLRFVRWRIRILAAVICQAWQIHFNIGKLICSE